MYLFHLFYFITYLDLILILFSLTIHGKGKDSKDNEREIVRSIKLETFLKLEFNTSIVLYIRNAISRRILNLTNSKVSKR